MLEQLRMQEVSQIILSKPEGAVIPGKEYSIGEPVMIINNPALSSLSFVAKSQTAQDAQGFISSAGITNNIDFVINDGSILYALWSYIYGYNENNITEITLRGNEYIRLDDRGHLPLAQAPKKLYLYSVEDNENILIPPIVEESGVERTIYDIVEEEYEGKTIYIESVDEEGNVVKEETKELLYRYYIDYPEADKNRSYLVSYEYTIQPSIVSHIKQIHNNVFCAMDIYIDAVDLKNDDKHTVIIHCDKVQVDTDLVLSVNNSEKASFTPIRIQSIAQGEELNKDVATIMVV